MPPQGTHPHRIRSASNWLAAREPPRSLCPRQRTPMNWPLDECPASKEGRGLVSSCPYVPERPEGGEPLSKQWQPSGTDSHREPQRDRSPPSIPPLPAQTNVPG